MRKNLSQLKRQRQNEKLRLRNRALKSRMRVSIRGAREAIAKDATTPAAKTDVASATREIDRMVTKGLIHRNTAARYKSRLTKRFNNLQPKTAKPAPTPAPAAPTA